MKVQVENVSSTEKRLSIEVEPAMVEKELTLAYQALSHEVKLPGFRSGKIPRRILEQKYKSDVEADVVRRVQMKAFIDAVKQEKVPVIGDPHMSGGAIVKDQPFAFTARVEVKPDVSAKDYRGLGLKKLAAEVTDAQVQEQLLRLTQSRATVEAITSRDVAQKGDFAVIDFDATKDGAPFPGNTGRGVTVEVAPGELVEGNLPQLEGAKVGEPKVIDYSFPADYRVEEVKGQTARFTVTVKELKEKKAPALDDAFAKTLGVESLVELTTRVRADLERAAKNRVAVDERDEVFKKLIEKNAIDIPTALVERGIDIMLDAAFGNMTRSGVDPRMLNLDWNKLRDELRPRSEVEVRGQLLLEAITKQEQITVTPDDLERKLETMAKETGAPIATVKAQYKSVDAQEALRHRVLEDKAFELVKSHAKYEG